LPVTEPSLLVSMCGEDPIPLAMPGLTAVPWADCGIDAQFDPDRETTHDEMVDFDRICGLLSVRAALPGDRFDPLGMNGQSMPLSDFFRGRRVPRERRARTPLVCDQLGIVWVAGHRISDRVKQTEATRRILSLRLLAGRA
jgi:tRNA(Ile)-lysidine synthase